MYIFHLQLEEIKDNRVENGQVAVFVSAKMVYEYSGKTQLVKTMGNMGQ